MVVATFDYYRMGSMFDAGGSKGDLPGDGRFTKKSGHVYVEYGLIGRLTLVGNVFYDSIEYADEFPNGMAVQARSWSNDGFSDQQVGLRYGILADQPFVLSLQASAYLPAGYDDAEPIAPALDPPPPHGPEAIPPTLAMPLGKGDFGTELRAQAGLAFGEAMTSGFVNAEIGYNQRYMGFDDQLRGEAGVGYKGLPRTEVIASWAFIRNLGAIPRMDATMDAAAAYNPLASGAFTLHRTDLTAIVQLTGAWRLQAAGFLHVAGKNTGAGGGFAAGVRAVWP
jgi:hypothetical protein